MVGKTATLEADAAAGRDAGAVASARHAVADAAQPARFAIADAGERRSRTKRRGPINTVRYGVSTHVDATLIARRNRHDGNKRHRSGPRLLRRLVRGVRGSCRRQFARGRRRVPERAADANHPGRRERCRLARRRARRRQIGGDRFAARHQGCAGRRSEDRQRRGALVAPRLHHRHRGRPDQRVLLRRRGQADGRLRHRGHPRSQRHPRRHPAGDPGCRHQRRRASATASC